jgi:hypothetical protein
MRDQSTILQNSHEKSRQRGKGKFFILRVCDLSAGEIDGNCFAFLDIIRGLFGLNQG